MIQFLKELFENNRLRLFVTLPAWWKIGNTCKDRSKNRAAIKALNASYGNRYKTIIQNLRDLAIYHELNPRAFDDIVRMAGLMGTMGIKEQVMMGTQSHEVNNHSLGDANTAGPMVGLITPAA